MKKENLEELQVILKEKNFVMKGLSNYVALISKVQQIPQFSDLSIESIAHILTKIVIDNSESFIPKKMVIDANSFVVKDERNFSINILQSCNISRRTFNVLKAAEIYTIGDLVRYSKLQISGFRNLGNYGMSELEGICSKSFEEIMSDCFIVEDEKLLAMSIEDCNFSKNLKKKIYGNAKPFPKTIKDLIGYSKSKMREWGILSELKEFFEKHGVVVSH